MFHNDSLKNRFYVLFLGVQGFYEYIKGASILEFLKKFLSHEDPNVRAKACSALGNMCRHSAQFYSSLVSIMMKNLKFENVLY
jgi:vesicle coat complex subunit